MKKSFLCWYWRSLVILFLLSITVTCVDVAAPPDQPNVLIDPPYKEAFINQTFSISISITNVTDLWFWEFKLWYTTANVNATSVTEGPFLKTGDAKTKLYCYEINDAYNATHGLVWANCKRIQYTGVDGDGVLATVSFKATSLGTSDLQLYYPNYTYPVKLEDPNLQDIACSASDGAVEVKSEISPYGPRASFTVSPTTLYAGLSVTFNASTSKAGCNGTHIMNITLYSWNFGDNTTANETSPIATHTYASVGNYTVTLTVYAPGATPETDTTTATIRLMSLATVFIDPPLRAVLPDFTFSVSVRIANVTNLYGYEFMLYYNTTVLDGVSVDIPLNHFLEPTDLQKFLSPSREINDVYNATHGRVWVAFSLIAPELPRNGSGILVTITFKSIVLGNSDLFFAYPGYPYPVKLTEPVYGGKPIPCAATNGTINVASEVPPFGPTARFTVPLKPLDPNNPELGRPFYAGESVTFNASASEAGCNGTHIMPITLYSWDFGDGTTSNETSPIATHTYASVGNYTVTLTVYAPGATPETDTTTATITVTTKPEEWWWSYILWIALFSILAVAIVITIILIMRRRRPRGNTGIEA